MSSYAERPSAIVEFVLAKHDKLQRAGGARRLLAHCRHVERGARVFWAVAGAMSFQVPRPGVSTLPPLTATCWLSSAVFAPATVGADLGRHEPDAQPLVRNAPALSWWPRTKSERAAERGTVLAVPVHPMHADVLSS